LEKCLFYVDGQGGSEDILFPLQRARFIKLDLVKRAYCLWFFNIEINVKGKDKAVLLSSSSDDRVNKAANALDWDKTTFWHSGADEDQWLCMEFPKPRVLGALNIFWGPDFAVIYEVLGSKDGTNWDQLYSMSDGKGSVDALPMNGSEYKFVKIETKKSSEHRGYSIQEIEVKGPEIDGIKVGVLTERVVCKSDPGQSYAIYIPKSCAMNVKPSPVVYGFSPDGIGTDPINCSCVRLRSTVL